MYVCSIDGPGRVLYGALWFWHVAFLGESSHWTKCSEPDIARRRDLRATYLVRGPPVSKKRECCALTAVVRAPDDVGCPSVVRAAPVGTAGRCPRPQTQALLHSRYRSRSHDDHAPTQINAHRVLKLCLATLPTRIGRVPIADEQQGGSVVCRTVNGRVSL